MTELYPDLPAPVELQPDTIRLTPLGGLGEVGRNMTSLELNGKILLVDCGVLFPEENQPGVDLILPDFSSLKDRVDDIVGLVLTHGHEDHIGAVPYMLKLREDIPIYGSELTLAFLEPKLKEHRVKNYQLHEVEEGQTIDLDTFSCEFVAVNHSIPDALAVMIRTVAGNVLITGDFKMDQLPLDHRITDLRSFARFGEEGVDLFLVDSTNAEVPGFVRAEREIGPVIESVFESAQRQIIVASFASHVHRVQQVLDAAVKTGRKVAMIGRSMERNMAIAAERGFLQVPPGVIEDVRTVLELPEDKRVFMATGSQGEPMAALARIANGTHKFITVGDEDTVIFASSLIPGNENSVNRVINDLVALGVNVVHKGNAQVHVSGHASAGELLYVYNIVQPRNVMPIHGEVRHLIANGKLAHATGVKEQNIAIATDGVAVDLRAGKATIAGSIPCEYVYVDGRSIGEIGEDELRERLTLSEEGFVTIFAVVELSTGTVLAGPHITARGMAEDDRVFNEVLPEVASALADAAAPGGVDSYTLQQVMRRVVGRWVNRRLRRRPMIVPVVIDA